MKNCIKLNIINRSFYQYFLFIALTVGSTLQLFDLFVSQNLFSFMFFSTIFIIGWIPIFYSEKIKHYKTTTILLFIVSILITNESLDTNPINPQIVLSSLIIIIFLILINSDIFYHIKTKISLYHILSIVGLFQSLFFLISHIIYKYFTFINSTNPTGVAISIAAILPFSLFLTKENKYKQWGWCIFIILYFTIWLSESRTSIISAHLIIFLFFYKSYFIKKNKLLIIPFIFLLFLPIFYTLFYTKTNSALGRTLIWNSSLSMIKDMPFTGFGIGKFKSLYMLYQAKYLEQHPDEVYIMLSDNVYHPFNEYLKILIELGWIPLLLITITLCYIFYKYQKYANQYNHIVFLSIFSIAISSTFSYPLYYPFIWVILIFNFAIIYTDYSTAICINKKTMQILLKSYFIICCLITLTLSTIIINNQRKWKTARNPQLNITEKINLYNKIYYKFNNNGYYLYDYAILLNQIKNYNLSIKIANECKNYLDDTDIQLLLSDNFIKTNDYISAEKSILLAHQMCPNRFIPLYRLMSLYIKNNDSIKAKKIAIDIINKKTKINSPKIQKIKKYAKSFINKQNLTKEEIK